MEALSETDNIDLYSSSSVRAIIELKWPLANQAMIKYLFYPYLIQLFLFLYYTTYVFEAIQDRKALEEAAALSTSSSLDSLGSQVSAAFFLYANQSIAG